jgi:Flp pilus assembly protein TadG
MMTAWMKFRSALRAFRPARAGNVAITFALAAIPIIGGAGAAIDYSRANSLKAAMQSALDSTALTLGKQYYTLNGNQLQKEADSIFAAVFTRPEAKNVTITAINNASGNTIQVNASASIDTTLVGVLGIKTIQVNGTSTATYAVQAKLRVALVLDNTGSMAQSGKMTALKTAAFC